MLVLYLSDGNIIRERRNESRMPARNLQIVERAYGDAPLTDSPDLAPDAEFDLSDVYPDQPVMKGVEAMRRFRDGGPWGASLRFVPERFIEVDDERVLVFVHTRSRGRASGAEVATRIAHEFTLHEEMIVRVKVYRDRDDAARAAGIADA